MVEFAGWDMPVQYQGYGLVAEHQATRTAAGLFDVSHMGEIAVRGPDALAEIDRLVTNDITALADGDATYALLTHPDGGTVDDLYVYRLAADSYLCVVNAANKDKDFAHMLEFATRPELFADRSDAYAQIALQGPKAADILTQVAPGEATHLARNQVRKHDFAGAELLVATTGYTGEAGYEIYCEPSVAGALWDAFLHAGGPSGLLPVGLGARDTLRLECGYALYGHELTDDINGYEARLGWAIKLKRADFIGRDALAAVRRQKSSRLLVGIEMLDRGIPRADYPVVNDGVVIGHVTSGTQSPTLGKPIALALIAREFSALGTELQVDIRGRLRAAAVCRYPFYMRPVSAP